ncbi:MAG: DUF4861 domain-containing protein [Bacteroidales bacterium]|nr:DUF4861 domain-containing protein [Bacteroidales bacterium]
MKHLETAFRFLIIITLFISCGTGESLKQKITVANKTSVQLKDKPVILVRDSLIVKEGTVLYPLLTRENGDTVASQLDDLDGDGQWDQLFFVVDIAAQDSLQLELKWVKTQPEYPVRTSVRFGKRSSRETPVVAKTSDTLYADKVHRALRYQPYQTDGPMWENDKVGFRHYFDGRNSKDLYGKKASYITPDTVGVNQKGEVEDNYHVMADWGRDVLAVGNAVGIGGFGLIAGDRICRLGITNDDTLNNIEETVFNIMTEGPVHTAMHFSYNNWKANGRIYQAYETTSIWSGMYAFKNSVKISGLQGDEALLVGLVNSNTDHALSELAVNDKYVILYTHDKQTYDKVWYLGLALILPRDAYLGHGEAPKEGPLSNTFFGKLKITENKPVDYYAIGAWELSDPGFTDSTYFKNYVQNLAEQLAAEVAVSIE